MDWVAGWSQQMVGCSISLISDGRRACLCGFASARFCAMVGIRKQSMDRRETGMAGKGFDIQTRWADCISISPQQSQTIETTSNLDLPISSGGTRGRAACIRQCQTLQFRTTSNRHRHVVCILSRKSRCSLALPFQPMRILHRHGCEMWTRVQMWI